MSHDTIPVPVNHNGLLEQTVSYTCREQFQQFVHSVDKVLRSQTISCCWFCCIYAQDQRASCQQRSSESLYKIIHIMHTVSHACHMTCSEEQSKLCVSSMCCRSRPGVQTSTLMRWIQACSSRRSFPPITSPAETSWRRPTCRRTSKVW